MSLTTKILAGLTIPMAGFYWLHCSHNKDSNPASMANIAYQASYPLMEGTQFTDYQAHSGSTVFLKTDHVKTMPALDSPVMDTQIHTMPVLNSPAMESDDDKEEQMLMSKFRL